MYRRIPAVSRSISEINPETDIRIRLVGNITDVSDSSIVLSDDTGKAEIILEGPLGNELERVRVFARVLPLEDGYELRGEIVQDMNNIDKELYKRVAGNK